MLFAVWYHLYEILKQEKLIYSETSGCPMQVIRIIYYLCAQVIFEEW